MAIRRVLTGKKKSGSRRQPPKDTGPRRPATLRHPWWTLSFALVVIIVLGIFGLNVNGKLNPTSLNVPGTQSSRATAQLQRYFGDSAPFAILLQGPPKALDQQGPALIRKLREDPKVTTISPWDRGTVARLRPKPDQALILADFHVDINTAVRDTVPKLNDILASQVTPPVKATQTGFATISRAIQDQSIKSSENGELIALPFLLLVLLLVFRSPVAALIPLTFGAITVITSRGVLSLISSKLSIDGFALTVSTMMGLALGVDYALLMVSRFREELAGGAGPEQAAWTTRRTAGRTTLFAGSTLFLSMFVSVFILPGALLVSLAGTVIIVVIISVTVATMVAPPLLTLLGPNVNRWRIGRERPAEQSPLMMFVNTSLSRPRLAAALIGGIVLILAAPAIGLKTGPPDTQQLPTDDPARQDAELVDSTIGPGFDAPFTVIASTDNGTMTDAKRLTALNKWQRKFASLPGVQAVIGPGQIQQKTAPLREAGDSLVKTGNVPGLGNVSAVRRLGNNLGRAADGVTQMRVGFAKASFGAVQLGNGSGQAQDGAKALANGLDQAKAGGEKAVGALNKFAAGSKKLAHGQNNAKLFTLQLQYNAGSIKQNLNLNANPKARQLNKSLQDQVNTVLPPLQAAAQVANDQLQTAWQQLQQMTVGKSDPHYAATLEAVRQANAAVTGTNPATNQPYSPGYTGLPSSLTTLSATLADDAKKSESISDFLTNTTSPQLDRLVGQLEKLRKGEIKLLKGTNNLHNGAEKLAKAATSLTSGLSRLNGGAIKLSGGIGQLQDGSVQLARSLADGFQQSEPIPSGLRRASVRVTSGSKTLDTRVSNLRHQSPGLFNSGYFVLSQLDGAPPKQRERAGSVVDLKHGGQAATILTIPTSTFNTPGSTRLYKKLQKLAVGLGHDTDATTGVAGGPAQLTDYNEITQQRIPWVVAAITVATFLMLVLVLRALPLAMLAVGLNLATVGVAFGVLTLLFHVPAGDPLGGHTYVDAVGATAIFGVVFGLSIDYAVFLLMRMRERHEEGEDYKEAIAFGLEKTARVITGAAAIMMAVFIVFGAAKIATVSQLGVGLTVAVILDATVVRIVLLPALMLMLGDRVWWLPRWLDRIMPTIDVHGAPPPPAEATTS